MNKYIREYYRSMLPEPDCFSGILKVQRNNCRIGTPVIASFFPMPYKDIKTKMMKNYIAYVDEYLLALDNILARASKVGHSKDILHGADLYKINSSDEINMVFQNSVLSLNCMDILNPLKSMVVLNFTINCDYLHFIGIKPLIYDDYLEIGDINEVVNDICDYIKYNLAKYRYITCTFKDVSKSSNSYIIDTIKNIIDSLRKEYRVNFSIKELYNNSDGLLKCVIDTVTISFYRLEDVIPIFDKSRTDGVFVEIFLSNSLNLHKNNFERCQYDIFKFIFSKYTDNVLSIDGEELYRDSYNSVDVNLERIKNRLEYETIRKQVKVKMNKIKSLKI